MLLASSAVYVIRFKRGSRVISTQVSTGLNLHRHTSLANLYASQPVDSENSHAVGPSGYCSPRHRAPFNPRDEGSQCVR
jgi:hypothetical protein